MLLIHVHCKKAVKRENTENQSKKRIEGASANEIFQGIAHIKPRVPSSGQTWIYYMSDQQI